MKRILDVQKEIGTLSKNAKNPFFKSAYLDLNDLLTHITPLLNSKGLLLFQPIEGGFVWSKIIDSENGNVICSSCIEIPPSLTDPQKIGSCISYFRRYTLKSLLAISETDDDGNIASKKNLKPVNNENIVYTLTTQDVDNWNGKIYEGHFVYVKNEKKRISKEQIIKLNKHPKFDKSSTK